MADGHNENEHAGDEVLFVCFAVTSVGVIVTTASIVCLVTIKTLNVILKQTLLSYSIANLLGCLFLLYQFISEKYMMYRVNLLRGMTCTVTLSLLHLLCLILAEYTFVSGKFRHKTKSFIGLLIICWMASIATCSLTFIAADKTLQEIVPVVILLSWLGTITFYMTIMKKHRYRKSKVYIYSDNLRRDGKKRIQRGNDILFPRIALFTYFLCALPWACQEIHYLVQEKAVHDTQLFVILIVYSINFYFISIISFYLRARSKWKNDFK